MKLTEACAVFIVRPDIQLGNVCIRKVFLFFLNLKERSKCRLSYTASAFASGRINVYLNKRALN